MILHDLSDAATYFSQGIEYVCEMAPKKSFLKPSHLKQKGLLKESLEQGIHEGKRETNNEVIILIGTTKKKSIIWLHDQLLLLKEKNIEFSGIQIVIVNYLKDSMIQPKYIKMALLKGITCKKEPEFVFVEFIESDYILQIEDEHNSCYSYKYLSKTYKEKLEKVKQFKLGYKDGLSLSQKSKFRKLERLKKEEKDYANSSLV